MMLKKAPQPQGFELYGPQPSFPDVPHAEWRVRIDKARRLMKENQVDLLMLWSPNNCKYFTAYRSMHWVIPSIQPMVALIPAEGEPVAVAGELFRWTIEGMSWVRDIRGQEDVHQLSSERGFPKEVAETVKDMGHEKSRIAIENGRLGHMYIPRPLCDIQTLMNALPKAQFVDGDRVIWGCRMTKSPLEIERLTRAAAIHKQAMTAVAEKYRPGMTEYDVGRIFLLTAYENGADHVERGHICCGPEREGMWDTPYVRAAIHKGDLLYIDMILNYEGYWADMGRVFNVGPATESWKKSHRVIHEGFDAAVAVMKPGVTGREVWQAVNRVVEPAGLGSFEMFGHGIGLDVHEPPVLGRTEEEIILQPGMTFEVESLGIGEGGLRNMGGMGGFQHENLVVITETGAYAVHGCPRDIMETSYC
ncbi:MAG: Xaa-Pro peptidase family protein [bacterium]